MFARSLDMLRDKFDLILLLLFVADRLSEEVFLLRGGLGEDSWLPALFLTLDWLRALCS